MEVGNVEESVLVQKLTKLWLKVVQQAVAEAEGEQLYGVKEEEVEGMKYRARKWLRTCSRDLYTVGSLAGLSKEQIRLLLERNKEKYGLSR